MDIILAIAGSGLLVSSFYGIMFLAILFFVWYDETKRDPLDGGWKWSLLITCVILLAFTFSSVGVITTDNNWTSMAIQYCVAALIVVLVKLVEGVVLARNTLTAKATTIRALQKHRIYSATTKLQGDYDSYTKEQSKLKSKLADKDFISSDLNNIKAFLFGEHKDWTYCNVKNMVLTGKSGLLTDTRLGEFIMKVLPSPRHGLMLHMSGKKDSWHCWHEAFVMLYVHIFEKIDTFVDKHGNFDFSSLAQCDIIEEINRFEISEAYKQDYHRYSQHVLDTKLKPTDQNLPHTDLEVKKSVIEVDFVATRVSGLIATWAIFWPFYIIELFFGRIIKMISDFAVSVIRLISLGFLNRFVFKNI